MAATLVIVLLVAAFLAVAAVAALVVYRLWSGTARGAETESGGEPA